MSLYEAMKLPPEGPDRTFSEDEKLPPLPLPTLAHTLQRYVDSVCPFVSPEQLARTKEIVNNFGKGIGKELHQKLELKAASSRNWVERWWEDFAYLDNRQPLIPFCSMTGVTPLPDVGWTFGPGRMVKHAALYMYYSIEMWKLLRAELLIPTQSADRKVTFSMMQFRRLFNCSRIPLPGRDRLDVHFKTESEGPCNSHIIVLCNGHMYVVETLDAASETILTPPEWEQQLQYILDDASYEPGQGIARFTCDDRDTWAKNRFHLERISGENARNLHLIDTAIMVISLDHAMPTTPSEITMESISGDYHNRWADKSLAVVFFSNGQLGGLADHTAFDGMISITCMFYSYCALLECNGEWTGSSAVRPHDRPVRLTFVLDSSIITSLDQADLVQVSLKKSVIIIRDTFSDFGKSFVVKQRIHPDTFVQIALQLTYYGMHGKPAPCYETATTRAYYNGRTETLRPCTHELIEWVKAMLSDTVSATVKVKLMKIAASRHDFLMKEARENAGCDRHLFGLYCVAVENGIPIPDLYSDPSYVLSGGGGNFKLSTSLVGYTPIGGGVAPMCLDGYGVFYNICPDSFSFTISVMRESSETSALKFFHSLCQSFNDMRNVLLTAQPQEQIRSQL